MLSQRDATPNNTARSPAGSQSGGLSPLMGGDPLYPLSELTADVLGTLCSMCGGSNNFSPQQEEYLLYMTGRDSVFRWNVNTATSQHEDQFPLYAAVTALNKAKCRCVTCTRSEVK